MDDTVELLCVREVTMAAAVIVTVLPQLDHCNAWAVQCRLSCSAVWQMKGENPWQQKVQCSREAQRGHQQDTRIDCVEEAYGDGQRTPASACVHIPTEHALQQC